MAARGDERSKGKGSVQSIDRTFAVLEAMADAGGIIGLSQLAERADLPLATIHRLVRTLVELGYVRQEPSRQYSLGPKLMRLVDGSSKRLGAWAHPYLADAVESLGESVNLAMLDGDEVVYVAQVQPQHNFMRMFTEVGRRTLPHATAVGKAMLVDRDPAEIRAILERTGMPRHTEHTLTTPESFLKELDAVRQRGYAMDEGEQELGVRCVAVAVPDAPRPMALSMSGPTTRMTNEAVAAASEVLHHTAEQLSRELARSS